MADVYADVVATLASAIALSSLAWQMKVNWWDRPLLVFDDERVAIGNTGDPSTGRMIFLGWSAQVTISNTGNAETTLQSLEWEFDSAPEVGPRPHPIFVAGSAVSKAVIVNVTDTAPGVSKATIEADAGSEFQPVVMGRNHAQRYTYRIGPTAVDGFLREATRARPVARFIDRKGRFGPKRHGVEVKHGDWTLAPRPDRDPKAP